MIRFILVWAAIACLVAAGFYGVQAADSSYSTRVAHLIFMGYSLVGFAFNAGLYCALEDLIQIKEQNKKILERLDAAVDLIK